MISEIEIQKIVEDFLQKISIEGEVSVKLLEDAFKIEILSKEMILSGSDAGSTLLALQHLIRLIVRKSLKENQSVYVDVNGYWKEKDEKIERECQEMVNALLHGDSNHVLLRPMNAHERKVVHNTVAGIKGVRTESVNQGISRCVQIKREES
jgi:spoIIIJ-associated protein